MTRRDPTTLAGCVRWPEGSPWKDSGEGGMWAAVLIPAATFPQLDPWDVCMSPTSTIALPLPDVAVHDRGGIYTDGQREWRDLINAPKGERRDRELERATLSAGAGVLAAVVLGATGGSWHDPDGDYFEVTHDTLTDAGRALVEALEAMYERPAQFVTYLDT